MIVEYRSVPTSPGKNGIIGKVGPCTGKTRADIRYTVTTILPICSLDSM